MHVIGGEGTAENSGVENVASLKMQRSKRRHQMTWMENAGVDNIGMFEQLSSSDNDVLSLDRIKCHHS